MRFLPAIWLFLWVTPTFASLWFDNMFSVHKSCMAKYSSRAKTYKMPAHFTATRKLIDEAYEYFESVRRSGPVQGMKELRMSQALYDIWAVAHISPYAG